jgi:hypothetical protein
MQSTPLLAYYINALGSKFKTILKKTCSFFPSMCLVVPLARRVLWHWLDSYDAPTSTWIYFLKKKSKVFDKFKKFKFLVENQTDKKINILRTDNG